MKIKIIFALFAVAFIVFGNNFEAVAGNYIQKNYMASSAKTLESSGEYTIIKSLGIVWDTKKPVKYKTVMTDKEVFQITANGKKKTLVKNNNPYFETIAEMTKSIFVLDKKSIDKYYTQKKISALKYEYTPKDKNIAEIIANIVLEFDAKNNIKNVKIFYVSKDTMEYELTVERTSNTITDEEREYFEKK